MYSSLTSSLVLNISSSEIMDWAPL